MRIACAFDHAGVPLREAVLSALADGGHDALDLGDADDYPQSARAVAAAILDRQAERGVLVCGSGAGVAVAAGKVRGIRAATVSDCYSAHQAVEHDNLNVLCLGARVIGPELARELVRSFAGAQFSGAERHVRRLSEVAEIERNGLATPDSARRSPTS
ncbi:MAG: RpiB/LacA/LacB family sugar-phosphate isomerase [Actinobacteria bacterium]|nr:RpiB/LacA/LacB family sugar-phosphate isomerase [Actinomycetota bacterium]